MVIRSGPNIKSATVHQPSMCRRTNLARTDKNDQALREITCEAPFNVKCKFQESHVSHEQWVPSGQEYISEGPTNMENHPPIMTTPLREVYKQRSMGRGEGVGIFGEAHERRVGNDQKVREGFSSIQLGPSREAYTQGKRVQSGLKNLPLSRWVGSRRFSHCKKFHTHKKQINWESDPKFIKRLGLRHHNRHIQIYSPIDCVLIET